MARCQDKGTRVLKTLIISALVAFFGAVATAAESPQVILVPLQTSIKKNATVRFDVFVYNQTSKSVEVPPINLFSAVYEFRDTRNSKPSRVSGTSKIATHPPPPHTLAPKRFERGTIDLEIPAQSGEVVELHIEIGRGPFLRSNSVLLYCQG